MTNRGLRLTLLAFCLGFPGGLQAAPSEDVIALMRIMPGDWAASGVFVDMQKFDKALRDVAKKMGGEPGEGIVADIKDDLPIADWVDFSKPIGIATPKFNDDSEPVVWFKVADATAKLKGLEGATQDGDIWSLKKGDEQFYARPVGDYLVFADSKEKLEGATKKDNASFAEAVKARVEMLDGRDIFLRLHIEAVRAEALGGIAQASAMAPMIGMMMAQQPGAPDPALMGSFLTTLFDASKGFMEQLDFVEISIGLDDKAGRLTVATGYKEGPIRNYLMKQKPAAAPLFADMEDQPFMMAVAYQLPGSESPAIDYLMGQMQKSMAAAPPSPAAAQGGADPAASKKAMEESLAVAKEMYGKIEGMSTIISYQAPTGLKMSGDYSASDPSRVLELAKKSLTMPNPMMATAAGAGSASMYESVGKKKFGDTEVEVYKVKLDALGPGAQQAQMFLGPDSRFAVGLQGGKVKFGVGDEKDVEKAFAGKVSKPLAGADRVKQAIGNLPAARNGIILVDALGAIRMLGPFMGLPASTSGNDSAMPIAISFTLSGNPARLDAYVPVATLEQCNKAFSEPAAAEPKTENK